MQMCILLQDAKLWYTNSYAGVHIQEMNGKLYNDDANKLYSFPKTLSHKVSSHRTVWLTAPSLPSV